MSAIPHTHLRPGDAGIASRAQLEAALLRQKTMTHLRLGDALVQENLISARQRDDALAVQALERGRMLGEILVAQGAITADQVRRVLVEQLGVPSVNLARFLSASAPIEPLPAELSRRLMAVALYRTGARIAIAMENPTWWEGLRELGEATGLKPDAAMAPRGDILAAIASIHGQAADPAPGADIVVANERLRVLSARMIGIQEEERRRISRDLHDDIGQPLTALKLGLHQLSPLLSGAALEILAACMGMADGALERVRQIAYDMRPPQLDELGMEEALRWLVERQRALTGIDIKCHFNGLLDRRFAGETESACYRIAQEALSNATRHARAGSILVSLEGGAHMLRLTVRDDGSGFDTARTASPARSLGLLSMDERATLAGGHLEVRSEPGHGTIVRAFLPAAQQERGA